MAAKPRDYAAEYARRNERAKAQGFTDYYAQRQAKGAALGRTKSQQAGKPRKGETLVSKRRIDVQTPRAPEIRLVKGWYQVIFETGNPLIPQQFIGTLPANMQVWCKAFAYYPDESPDFDTPAGLGWRVVLPTSTPSASRNRWYFHGATDIKRFIVLWKAL